MATMGKKYEDILAAFDRLSRREKFMVSGLAICFVVFVGVLVSMWVSSSLGGLERRVTDRSRKLQEMVDMRSQFEEAKEARKQSEQRIKKARDIQLMGTLENLATRLGIDTNDMKMNPRSTTSNPESSVEEKRVEVEIPRITIDRLVDFLAQLERKSESIAVRKLHVRKNFKDPSHLDVRFTVSKFQVKEEKNATAPKGTPPKKSP
jgi:hypothetical protein